MRAPHFLLWFCLFALFTACDQREGALDALYEGPKAPTGTKKVTEAVDGLLVGHRLMAAGEFELALRSYTRAAAEQGLNADIYSAMGSANLKLGRLGQAKALLKTATEKDPKFVPAWNNLGVVYSSEGAYRQAAEVFKLAFALDSGKSDEIRQNLTRALENSKENGYPDIQENQAYELVRRGNGRYLLLETGNNDV